MADLTPSMPKRTGQSRSRRLAVARRWLGPLAALVIVWLSGCREPAPPSETGANSAAPRPPLHLSVHPDYDRNWPRFRGPDGSGVCTLADIPAAWDGATGEGVAWKTPIPLPGKGSPIVWGDRVFCTGGDKTRSQVYCLSVADGRLAWTGEVKPPESDSLRSLEIPDMTGYAAPTPATDGARVFALFGNGLVACFDFAGKRLWMRDLGVPENMYGHSSSLLTFGGLLFVLWDQGMWDPAREEPGLSRLLALDTGTGQTVWETPRPVSASWATPILIGSEGRRELITCAAPWVIAYDPASGKELWRAGCINDDVAPSPVFAGGLVFTANIRSCLAAIRPFGRGDVTKTHVVWTWDEHLPSICSPVSDGERVYALTTEGLLTCLNARDGAKLWEHDFATPCYSSPSIAGDRLYVTDTTGVTHIFATGMTCKPLGTSSLGEAVETSMAFAPGRIYLRGATNLYCIGK